MMSAQLEPAFNQFTKMPSMISGYWLPSESVFPLCVSKATCH